MRTFIFVISTFFIFQNSNAQIEDNFSDGDFSSNPTWQGDIDNFIINDNLELQLNAPALGSSKLFVLTQVADSTIWEFFFKMDFAPSNSNKLRVYLQAENSDLQNSNGYFLEIGENGSDDALHFYKRDGGNETLLNSATVGALSEEPSVARLRIERTAEGHWSFFTDYNGGDNLELDFEITDNTWLGGDFIFGFYCEYTESRKDKYFFDDIKIQPLLPDTEAPILIAAEPISETEIQVLFNESLDENSIQNTNFSINNGIGNPLSSELEFNDKSLVLLSLNTPLQNQENYTLTISNISDEIGNIAGSQMTDFSFLETAGAESFDILINEIMADPTPSVGLPAFEFVELYNRSDKIFDLADFGFDNGTSFQLLSSFLLFPNEYLILCDEDNISEFESFGKVLGISNFPPLTNSGDELILTDPFGDVVHSVNYSEEWYLDNLKREGGWTLEMISPFNICENENNWRASQSLSGGTPGIQNSIYEDFMDEESPDLIRVFVDADKPDEIQLFFSENMDKSSVENISNYAVSNNLEIQNASLQEFDNQKVVLSLSSDLELKTVYEITLKTELTDCLGNAVGVSNTAQFGLPEFIEERDIIINEILFNPEVGGVDFVELYNRSSKILNLSDLLIGNLEEGVDTIITSISQDFLFLPQTYIVLCESPAIVKTQYQTQNPQWVLDNELPALDNESGNVTLINPLNNPPTIIDAFNYDEDFHHVLLEDKNGVSLERINPASTTQDKSNWHSAAQTVGFGTPTYQNSQFISSMSNSGNVFSIPEKTFSPDGDGFEDFLQIYYQTNSPDFVANVKIFDSSGRLVKNLASNELLATEGFLKWDGSTNENRLARLGIYIVYAQIFSPSGDVQEFKETCVLAERF